MNKRTALGVAVCVVYNITVREWPDLADQKVGDAGSSYVLSTTVRVTLAARKIDARNEPEDLVMRPDPIEIIP